VGDRVVVATSHDSAWKAAFDLARAGTAGPLVVDVRPAVDGDLLAEARGLGIEALCGGTVTDTRGRLRVSGVRVNSVGPSGAVGRGRWVGCDALLMSGGWTPSVHLFPHTGGKLVWDEASQVFLPGQATEACRCAGAGAREQAADGVGAPMVQERNTLRGTGIPDVAGRLSVTPAPDCARLSLRLGPDDRTAAEIPLGFPLPDRIGRTGAMARTLALRLGPDEWYPLMPPSEVEGVERRLTAGMPAPFSLVDVSHREVGIEVVGPAATLALTSICALDLDAMPAGSATRTILDRAQVVLIEHGADRYRIEVRQSFADHVRGLLQAVARGIALDI